MLLVTHSDNSDPRSHPLSGSTVTVGRYGDNQVVIDDPSVSGHHARIVLAEDQWVVRDVQSSNGTRLNGSLVTEAVLNPGDTLQFGTVQCTFTDEPTAPGAAENGYGASITTSGAQPPKPPTRPRSRKTLVLGTLLWGCLGIIVVGGGTMALFAYATITSIEKKAKDNAAPMFRQLIANGLVKSRQRIFDSIHPVGTATNLVVHEVDLRDKNGNEAQVIGDVRSFTVRYTLYWQGPVTSDGFTKVEATYDCESQRWINSQLLATNGITTNQFIEGAFMIGIQMALDQ